MLFSGLFLGVRSLNANISEHSVCPFYIGEYSPMKMEQTECSETLAFNLLKHIGYVMHHQFNIQKLYALPRLYLCDLYLSDYKQRLVPLIIN
jgi:hypothetical protein